MIWEIFIETMEPVSIIVLTTYRLEFA